jgi:hypothetical protein
VFNDVTTEVSLYPNINIWGAGDITKQSIPVSPARNDSALALVRAPLTPIASKDRGKKQYTPRRGALPDLPFSPIAPVDNAASRRTQARTRGGIRTLAPPAGRGEGSSSSSLLSTTDEGSRLEKWYLSLKWRGMSYDESANVILTALAEQESSVDDVSVLASLIEESIVQSGNSDVTTTEIMNALVDNSGQTSMLKFLRRKHIDEDMTDSIMKNIGTKLESDANTDSVMRMATLDLADESSVATTLAMDTLSLLQSKNEPSYLSDTLPQGSGYFGPRADLGFPFAKLGMLGWEELEEHE